MPPLPPTAPPPWHAAIARALERGSSTPASRYLQLATVRPDGRPAVRSVVFRGWFGDDAADADDGEASAVSPTTPRLGFVTDARTAKVEHASLNPRAEACWYFTEARSQFRLSGTLAVIGARAAAEDARAARLRLSAWERLSPGTREWHSGPAPGAEKEVGGGGGGGTEVLSGPAATVAAAAEGEASVATATSGRGGGASASKPPPHDNFCLVLLDVDAVDHVDLERDERTLWELELEEGGGGGKAGEWRSRAVWP